MMGRVQNLILKGFASSFEALRLIVRSSEKTMKKKQGCFLFLVSLR